MANFVNRTSTGNGTRDQMLERPLPHSAESERAILGGVLLDNSLVNQAIELLKPEDFYVRAHQLTFRGMIALSERGSEINPILIGEELRRLGELEAIGGFTFLNELTYGLPHFTNITHYASVVRGKSTMRQLVKAANVIISEALEEEDEPEVILDHAEQLIFALADERTRQGFTHIKPIADTLLERVQEMGGRSVMLTGLTTGFSELDAMTSGLQPQDLIIIAARPSMGKCLPGHTLIDDPATGERLTLEACIKRRMESVYGVSDAGTVRPTKIAAWIDSGIKPCFLVRTRTGREVEVTGHHPFLTINGWTPLCDLRVGGKIGVPRRVPAFGTDDAMPDGLVRLIAYFIAEGGLTGKCPLFTNTDPALVEDFNGIIAEHFPQCVVRRERITYKVVRPTRSLWKASPNPLTAWLKELGLWGRYAAGKSFPACVWRWTREKLAEFLRVLFSCDGTIYPLAGYPRIEFAVASKSLAQDVQHALVRFGVVAKLWRKGERCWRVEITEPESVALYQKEIGWIGEKATRCLRPLPARRSNVGHVPQSAWQLVREASARRGYSLSELARLSGERIPVTGFNPHTNRGIPQQRLQSYARVLVDAGLQRLANPDIYWDEIVAIEPTGEQQVYDLTVPDGANFIAQDVCVHNTALCLTLAQNAAVQTGAVVGVFSLEMSKESLVTRMLCSEGRVDSSRFRNGFLAREEWGRLASALGTLAEAKIFIDDTPGISVLEMRAKARRLAAEHKRLDLIIVDYLQLMGGGMGRRVESRQQEVSQISRELKGLAKEMNVPLVALSQLSRATESRTDHRPQLSDLRESGCLAGDSLVTMADTGAQVPIKELVGRTGFAVYALNEETMGIERAIVSRAFATGRKPVFTLKTRLGRSIRATGNHKFRAFDGWRRLDELQPGEHLALPRSLDCAEFQSLSDAELALLGHLIGDGCTLPRHVIQYTTRERDLAETVAALATEVFGNEVKPRINEERKWLQVYLTSTRRHTHGVRSAVTEWLMELGVFGLRSHEKRIPDKVFQQPQAAIALFLRHLWATDGCIHLSCNTDHYPALYYATSSYDLACGVQSLLLRLGINARLSRHTQSGKGRDQYHVSITGRENINLFFDCVGTLGERRAASQSAIREYFAHHPARASRDVLPREVWRREVVPAMSLAGITSQQLQASINTQYRGTRLYASNISRDRAALVARVVCSKPLQLLANSDVYWDRIVSIELDGEEEVYDLTVEKFHNFIANNIILHNSLEQDADVVAFIYREEQYNRTDENAGIAEILIAKQRNGPTGTVKLAFLKEFTRFENMWNE